MLYTSEAITMELESNPSCESEPVHMSGMKAIVTDILSDVLGVLTTVVSKERILFDVEELYLAGERCDPSRPLSSYVVAGKTELYCDASFLPGNNEWNIRYKATCVWKHEKPPFMKIFGRHISNCSATVSLIPGHLYEGHVVQVSPPNAALAICVVNSISFPVLIFLNRLFRNSSLEKLQNCEWIQDHLNTGDKVEFIFENIERKSMHKKFHAPAFAWKLELKEQRKCADEEQRKHAHEQEVQHDSCVSGVMWRRGDSQGDNAASNVATSEGTDSDVTCVGISDVGTCTETSGSTSLTEPPDKRHVDETKGVSTVGASEPASNTSLLLYEEAKLKECGIYTVRERGSTNLSSVKSQENDTKAAATAFSQHCDMQEASHTKLDEPVADLLDIAVRDETRHLPAVEHGICGPAAESHLDGTHSVHGISEREYGAVSLYRVLQSVQSDAVDHLHLAGTGIIQNDCAVQTVHPQFLYELLKPPDERGFQFRATLIGFVIFSHTASGPQKRRNSHSPADVSSNTGVGIPPDTSHEQFRMSNSLAALGIELEMPLDPLNPTHIAVPRTPSSSHAGMTAYVTGISLPGHASCNVFTLPSNDCLQIPVCLYKVPAHNPTFEYKAVTLQGKFHVNSSTVALDSTETICDRQSHDLDSCIQDPLSQEMTSDPSCELQSKLSGHKDVLPQTCEQRSSKSVWDTPVILVPVFVPLSSHSSSEHTSVSPSTRWTLISGSVATEKHCLMYVPSSALSCSAQSDKQRTQSPDQLSEDNFTSPEELSTSKPHSSHFGKYTGNINSLGYDHGTISFTVDGKEERASFYRQKVYVNGTRIYNQSKLRDVLSLGMPVTLDVRPYKGESFTYKATAVYVELNVEEQPEVCDVASKQKDASDVVSVNSDRTKLSRSSLQNDTAIPPDQTITDDETYLALKCWENFCAENADARRHVNDSVSRPCAYESNVTNRESCKDSTAGTIISPRKDTDIIQSITAARQETTVHAHLTEETSPVVSTGVLRSQENTIVPKDYQEKVAESEFDTEFKPPSIVKPSQIIGEVTSSDYDTGELSASEITLNFTCPMVLLPQSSSTQTTDKITVSDNDPGELFTSNTNTSDVASSVDLLPQSSIQTTDKITVSDNDPGELFTSKTNASDVASSVALLPQSSTQTTDKITVSDNDPGELFTSKTNASDVASSVDLLPESAKNVAGVIDGVWMSTAVLMTARLNGVKLRVLIYGMNLYIKKQRCTLTNTSWQQRVQGVQVFADVLKLRDHPSGAVYLASSAWKGKKPGNGSSCNITPCGTEKCVNCPKKAFSSDVDPSTNGSKVNSDAGRQKSKHCKTDGINYATENIGTCRGKPVLNDKSHSLQLKIDGAFEEMKQKYHKALRSKKSLVGKKYVGTVERYAVDDGCGLVNFHLENGKARAVFFREHIFAKGISVTDSYVKDNITAGRFVTVSAVKPYYKEDVPYAVNIDTEYQDTKGEPATLSYSVAATRKNEQEEVTPTVEDLECQSSKFRVKEREMFYKRRLCYDWDQGSVEDGDRRKDTEVTDHPEEAGVEKQSCWGMTVDDTNVTASSDNRLEVTDHPNQVKMEKLLCLDKPVRDSNKSASLDNKGTAATYHSDEVKADKPLCQERTVGDESVTASLDKRNIKVTDDSDELKTDKPSCQEETVGNAVVPPSTGKQQLMQLPVTSTPHTGLAKQLKERLARVKRYESSMRGILEYSISGAVLEIVFDRRVVKFCGQNEITDMGEHLPVGSVVYFDGEVVGEDSLLGCSDIVVTRVSRSKTHRKPPNSKFTHSRTLELAFSSLHEGLFTGRTYEGIVTKINPPRAFVATVTEGGKTYDVFVLNTFFSPAEYGAKLPLKHSVLPYVAKGYKVHLMVERRQEVNSKYTYEWFAVDAWTEAGDNGFGGSKHKTPFTSKDMDYHPEGGIDADQDDHLEGVIMTLYPEWGVLKADHLNDEVTFFARETFLFGVRLTCVDLREVFRPGKSRSMCVSS